MNLDDIESLIGAQIGSPRWQTWWRDEIPTWVQRHRGVAIPKSNLCFVRGAIDGYLEAERITSLHIDLTKLEGRAMGIARGLSRQAVRERFGTPTQSQDGLPALRIPPSDTWDLEGNARRRVDYDARGALALSVFRREEPARAVKVSRETKTKTKTVRAKQRAKPRAARAPTRIRPQSLLPAFRARLLGLGLSLESMTPRTAVEQMVRYYEEVEIEGRSKHVGRDRLLYEQHVERGVLQAHVVRQIYSGARGVQLDLGWTGEPCGGLDGLTV